MKQPPNFLVLVEDYDRFDPIVTTVNCKGPTKADAEKQAKAKIDPKGKVLAVYEKV